ncbi:hypothetical protein EVA_10874 [gut metagenome]|uniref:Uncharacterized protein n=1 Tax=gut metagenome TaxID=749906 RepID=J9G2E4_9ZZZZ
MWQKLWKHRYVGNPVYSEHAPGRQRIRPDEWLYIYGCPALPCFTGGSMAYSVAV